MMCASAWIVKERAGAIKLSVRSIVMPLYSAGSSIVLQAAAVATESTGPAIAPPWTMSEVVAFSLLKPSASTARPRLNRTPCTPSCLLNGAFSKRSTGLARASSGSVAVSGAVCPLFPPIYHLAACPCVLASKRESMFFVAWLCPLREWCGRTQGYQCACYRYFFRKAKVLFCASFVAFLSWIGLLGLAKPCPVLG